MKSGELSMRIAAAHAPPEWACFFEVPNATGSMAKRFADVMAMSLWPSRGLTIRGFEIKVTRADLRRESVDPTKAEEMAQYCDEWWLVTPPGLIQNVETEVPPAWGLMVASDKGGLKTIRAASQTEAKPLTRGFLASILRRAHEMVVRENAGWVRLEDIEEKLKKAEERGKEQIPWEVERIKNSLAEVQKRLKDFQDGTGIDLTTQNWALSPDKIARAYRLGSALLGQHGMDLTLLSNALANTEKLTRGIREQLEPLLRIDKEAEKKPNSVTADKPPE